MLAEDKNQDIVLESFDMKDLNSQNVVSSNFSTRKSFIHSPFTQNSFKRLLTVHRCFFISSSFLSDIKITYKIFIAHALQNGSLFALVF